MSSNLHKEIKMTTKTKTPTKSRTKKPAKYHYLLDFKSGDYFDITRSIESMYPVSFMGCGIGLGGFDVHLKCTSDKFQNIRRWIKRNFRNKFKITRYTDEELYGDNE
jgi:hypothetical protein